MHNKTFFFGDYQGTRIARAGGSSINDIPPAALRAGDFSKAGVVIYDPTSRRIGPTGLVIADPLAGNIIPQSQMNASSVAIAGIDSAAEFRSARRALPELLLWAAAFLEHRPGRYPRRPDSFRRRTICTADSPFPKIPRPALAASRGSSAAVQTPSTTVEQAVLSYIHIFTPSLVNEFRFGFIRHNGSSFGSTGDGARLRRGPPTGHAAFAAAGLSKHRVHLRRTPYPAPRNSAAGAAAIRI